MEGYNLKKEIDEAIMAGKLVSKSLAKMIKKLNSAYRWGMWDIFGGKLFTNLWKHRAIRKANALAHEVENDMRRFQRELADVKEARELQVQVSNLITFADFVFDGLFVDVFVQNKINRARKEAKKAKKEIDRIVRELENKYL